jgi:ATP/maltotriose-dependent transcriptional regulator MalT/DNA-binding SARP family transcriptional activator
MPALDPLLKHAITPPAFERTKLHRERLVDAIHANIPRKLIAIAAPPGYGKTTLLADFHANTEVPVCWVRLSEADQDVMRLAGLLRASLERRFRRLRGRPPLEALAGASTEAVARGFAAAIEEMVGESFVIVFDDIQWVNRSKPVLTFLDALIDAQPQQVTIIAAGREVVEVSLAKLMAEGDLAGFGPQDLALTKDELLAFARGQLGSDLADDEADRLLLETRGWITGVLLSSSLSSSGLKGILRESPPMVHDYLASVVLNRQPDDLRRFVLDSSVLPVMTVEACDHITQRKDSQRFLSRLVRENLFLTSTSEAPRTFEYHPQFRAFLLETLQEADPTRFRRMQLRAAEYLSQRGMVEEAIELMFEAKSFRKAAALADEHAAGLHRAGRAQTLEVWKEKLDASGTLAPKVLLSLATAYADQGRLDACLSLLDRKDLEVAVERKPNLLAQAEFVRGLAAFRHGDIRELRKAALKIRSTVGTKSSAEARGRLLRIETFLAKLEGREEDAVVWGEQAADLFSRVEDQFALGVALIDIGFAQMAQGLKAEPERTLSRAVEILGSTGGPVGLAIALTDLGILAFKAGRYEEALQLHARALKYARQAASASFESLVLCNQADIFSDLGMGLQAAELFGQALALASKFNDQEILEYGCVQTAVLHRRQGSMKVANEWLRRAVALTGTKPSSASVQIQLAAQEGDIQPERSLATLHALVESEGPRMEAESRVRRAYFEARAHFGGKAVDKARESIRACLALAGTYGEEQVIAGELAFNPEMTEFAKACCTTDPVLATVLARLETMASLSRRFTESAQEGAPSHRLGFFTLGRSAILWGTQVLAGLKPLSREVLFFLVDRREVERDVLMETFWPHHPPGRQTANLHMTIYSLRRALGKDLVILEGTIYQLNPEIPTEYDVARFEQAAKVAERLAQGDPRRQFALIEAINSYGGSFLPEFTSEWTLDRRRTLQMRYLDLLTANAEEALLRNQPSQAISALRPALDIDPLRDDLNQQYIEALALLGRRSEMVEHYQKYVRLLSEELGLDPPEETRSLYQRLIG